MEESELQKLQTQLGIWADKAFGAHNNPIGCLNHLKEECLELLEDPYDIMEYADALTLILDASRRVGISADDLVRASWTKLEINKSRKWEEPDEYGVCRHIKD